MNPGDVVYIKKAKRTAKRRGLEAQFKGHGVALLLGHIPEHASDIKLPELFGLLGNLGFIAFDDIGEFLDEEQLKTVIEKFKTKYAGPAEMAAEESLKIVKDATAKHLIDAHGGKLSENNDETIEQ